MIVKKQIEEKEWFRRSTIDIDLFTDRQILLCSSKTIWIIRTSREHVISSRIIHFHDGQSALDYLFRRNGYCDPVISPRPQLILLDVHLPGIDRIDILRMIKISDELRMIPVVVLTTSATEQDIMSAYRNHANSYVIKVVGGEEFKELMDILCAYWLGRNQGVHYPDAN